MKAEYINHMGDDLMVVNAARVSFDKESAWDPSVFKEGDLETHKLGEGDVKLVRYLARHNHWTPFSHPQVTWRMTAPIFVARQAFKHKVGFTENEISRRYVDDTPEFFMPDEWRGKPVNAKQGSSDELIDILTIKAMPGWDCSHYKPGDERDIKGYVLDLYKEAEFTYFNLIENGVAPEQARMVLPQAMYTSWYWTGSLAAWARFYQLRTDSHAQSEIQELAGMIGPTMADLFPVCWKELTSGQS